MALASLPIVLAVVLAELAIGGAFLMWFVDRGGRAPSGFLKLVGFIDVGALAASLALVPTFPRGDLAERAGIDTEPLSAFATVLVVALVLMIIQVLATFLPVRGLRQAAGILASFTGARDYLIALYGADRRPDHLLARGQRAGRRQPADAGPSGGRAARP